MRILGIDIGYGHTKVVFKEKKIKEFKFPTAVAFHKKNGYGLDENEIYSFEGKDYLVGESALLNALDLRDPTLLMKYAPLLLAHAIKLIGLKDFDIISTGISVLNYNKYRKVLAENLKSFTVNNERYKFKKVIISFQGEGVLYDENVLNENVLVIDGGYLTLDAINFNNAKINPAGAYATRLGVSKIVENVQNQVTNITDYEYSMAAINEAINKGFIVSKGKRIDLSSIIKDAIEDYALEFKSTIKGKMRDYLQTSDVIVIAGGLAHLLKNASNMPDNIVYAAHPEYANARGYFLKANGGV